HIPHRVVPRRSKPHPSLGIVVEFPHSISHGWSRILGYFSSRGIQTPDRVHDPGGVPDLVGRIDSDGIRRRLLSGELVFLEGTSFRVQPNDLPSVVLSQPPNSVRIDLKSAPRTGLRWRSPSGDFLRLIVHLENSPLPAHFVKPDVAGLVEIRAVRVGSVFHFRKDSSLGIEAVGKRAAGNPQDPLRIFAHRCHRYARP